MCTTRFVAFSILFIGAGALQLNTRQALATKEPTDEMEKLRDNTVALVMFDHTYLNLFSCFAEHYAKEASSSLKSLHIVALDEEARDHAEQIMKKHPAARFSIQHIQVPKDPKEKNLARIADTHADRLGGSSIAYQAYFWKVVGERLKQGKHVLHIDLDSIVVGDPWKAVADADLAADIVSPGNGRNFEFILFKNTPATREVVDFFAAQWEGWYPGSQHLHKWPTAEQFAFNDYMIENGCPDKNTQVQCKTHKGTPLLLAGTKGVLHQKVCDYPVGCQAKAQYVVHGRGTIKQMCPNQDLDHIVHHS